MIINPILSIKRRLFHLFVPYPFPCFRCVGHTNGTGYFKKVWEKLVFMKNNRTFGT